MTEINVIGNRQALLPWRDGYLTPDVPSKLRIYRENDVDLSETPWQMDECGVVDGQFAVSEWCINFETFEQALEQAREILREEVRHP